MDTFDDSDTEVILLANISTPPARRSMLHEGYHQRTGSISLTRS